MKTTRRRNHGTAATAATLYKIWKIPIFASSLYVLLRLLRIGAQGRYLNPHSNQYPYRYRTRPYYLGNCFAPPRKPPSSGCLSQITSNHMKNNSLPHSELKGRPNPSDVIKNLIRLSCDPACPAKYRDSAQELGVIFMLDATAETDLIRVLVGDHPPDTTTPAGLDQFLDMLTRAGVIEGHDVTADGENFRLRFLAQLLVDLLMAMPHVGSPCWGLRVSCWPTAH